MKDSQVYLRAAKLIDSGEFDRSCWAIGGVKGVTNPVLLRNRYVDAVLGTVWTCDLFGKGNCDGLQAKKIRVLALLFMHQIALDEEAK